MHLRFSLLFFFIALAVVSQEKETVSADIEIKIDSLYREDQFYFSFALNTLLNKPDGIFQEKFSSGFSAGFLRDFPVNRNRTIALAAGVGVAYNNHIQNLKISNVNAITSYSVIDRNQAYSKNRFNQLLLEVPIEFRFRTSTFESYKFWRFYGGFKVGYLLNDRSIFEANDSKIIVTNNKDFNKFQYGTYLSVGYNAVNVFAYYGLNPLFKSAKTDTKAIDMKSFTLGIMFYIL